MAAARAGAAGAGLFDEPDTRAVAGDRQPNYDTVTDARARSTPGCAGSRRRRAGRDRHRDRFARRDAAPDRRHVASPSSRARRAYIPLAPQLRRRAGPAAARRGAGAAASPGWRTPTRPRSASTSSTTPRASPTTASTVHGYRARHHAAELRARGAQAARPGQPGRAPPRPHRRSTYEDVCGKGAHQIPFAQVDGRRAPPSTPARTPT